MDTDRTPETGTPQSQEGKKPNKLLIGGAVLVVLVLGLLFLRSMNAEKNSKESVREKQRAMDEDLQPATGGNMEKKPDFTMAQDVTTITMDAGSFYYSVKEIRVKQGQKVKIVMMSKDMMHNFNIDELGVKMPVVKAGDQATIEFVASKTGTFEYYCSIGQHRKNGQVGKIIVE